MRSLRLFRRLVFVALYTSFIVAKLFLNDLFFGKDIRRSMRIRQDWATKLLPGIGIRLTQFGPIPEFPCLLVGNHRSYIDPILILRYTNAYPVAKAEMASWPLFGKGARFAGIIYVDRGSAKSRAETLAAIADKIQEGHSVILFPEGTTSSSFETLPFKRGAFQIASKKNIPVVPVTLVFDDMDNQWVGTDSFLTHIVRQFKQQNVGIRLYFGPVLRSDDYEELLSLSQSWINETIRQYQT